VRECERARKWAGGHMRNSIERPDTDSLKAALTHNRALGQRPILGPLPAAPPATTIARWVKKKKSLRFMRRSV